MHSRAKGNTGLQDSDGHYQIEVPIVFASGGGAATRGQAASIILRQGHIHLNSAAPNHDSPSTPLPILKVKSHSCMSTNQSPILPNSNCMKALLYSSAHNAVKLDSEVKSCLAETKASVCTWPVGKQLPLQLLRWCPSILQKRSPWAAGWPCSSPACTQHLCSHCGTQLHI